MSDRPLQTTTIKLKRTYQATYTLITVYTSCVPVYHPGLSFYKCPYIILSLVKWLLSESEGLYSMPTVSVRLSLQCLCLSWDVRSAHIGALLFLLGPAGTIGRLSEQISRPCEAQALQRQWRHISRPKVRVCTKLSLTCIKGPCGLWKRKVHHVQAWN